MPGKGFGQCAHDRYLDACKCNTIIGNSFNAWNQIYVFTICAWSSTLSNKKFCQIWMESVPG